MSGNEIGVKKLKKTVLAAVARDVTALRCAAVRAASLMKDKEFVLAAIAQNGSALGYADESLKKDKEVVLAAVAQDGSALQFADESLFEDEELLAAGGQAARDED